MKGQQLIQEIGMFPDDLKAWKRLPTLDRTWAHFKMDFTLVHQELRENNNINRSTQFSQANNNGHDAEIVVAMENLATATAADRSANAALTATVANLTSQLAEANKQLAKANVLLAKAKAKGGGGRGRGGGRGANNNTGDNATAVFQARIGGPIGRHYCWSCGDFCSSPRCRNKNPGHKDEATQDNKMDGSTHSFA